MIQESKRRPKTKPPEPPPVKVDISLVDDLIDEKNAEIKRLTEALENIISATNHCAHDSEEASMMIHKACTIAKQALN